MKIALLAGANSIHTVRWANGLKDAGLDVYLISQHPLMHSLNDGIHYYQFPNRGVLGYFFIIPKVRKILNDIKPDIVNAHYASGYGTTARFVNYHPYIISVWGSDIYLFPNKSFIHKWLVKRNLLTADAVASTSVCMANETLKLIELEKTIAITPFGVDEKNFFNQRKYFYEGFLDCNKIVIGTVKSLKHVYGIDILIKSFAELHKKLMYSHPQLAEILILKIVGGGDELENLKSLTLSLKINKFIEFVGQVSHEKVPNELAGIDIYVALSRSESFGVAILEAGLNQCPVIVSNVGGLPELVINHKTGIIVESENIEQATEAMYYLVTQSHLIAEYGKNAQNHVLENYTWKKSVAKMINTFEDTIKEFRKVK